MDPSLSLSPALAALGTVTTIRARAPHLCPYGGANDVDNITITFTTEDDLATGTYALTVELGSLKAFLNGFTEVACTTETLVAYIADALARLTSVPVTVVADGTHQGLQLQVSLRARPATVESRDRRELLNGIVRQCGDRTPTLEDLEPLKLSRLPV